MASKTLRTVYHETTHLREWQVVESCWRAYQAGDLADGGGGVTPERIAEDVPNTPDTVSHCCRDLVDEGVFVQLLGMHPTSGNFVHTYAPRYLLERDPDAPPAPEITTPTVPNNCGHGGGGWP